jgi:hypothetical protein
MNGKPRIAILLHKSIGGIPLLKSIAKTVNKKVVLAGMDRVYTNKFVQRLFLVFNSSEEI